MALRSPIAKRLSALVLALALLLTAAPAAMADFSAIVTKGTMPVYSDPSLTEQVGTLEEDTVVVVTGYSGSVARITYKGKTGYARISDMERVDQVAEEATVNSTTLVYKKASTASASATLKKGLTVYVLEVRGDWARIEMNGMVGFTFTRYLSTDSEWSDILRPDAPSADPDSASLAADAKTANLPATVSASSVTVYKGASTSATALAVLEWGTSLTVVRYDCTWAYIEKDGRYGYCLRSGLTPVTQQPAPTPTPVPEESGSDPTVLQEKQRMDVISSTPVYKSPSSASTRLGTLKPGAEVLLLAYNSTWAYVELNGNRGFCYLSALQKAQDEVPELVPETTPAPETPAASESGQVLFTATVVQPGAKAYHTPSADSMSVSVAFGREVSVYAYKSGWAYVGIGDNRGYMPIESLSKDSYTALEHGNSGDAVLALQKRLLALGYFDGAPAGNYATVTYTAVRRFQAACGFTDTGAADVSLIRVLMSEHAPESPILSANLSNGSVGDNVTRLQTRLFHLGYLSKSSSVDGEYGPTTQAAVKLFQAAAGVEVTGSCDRATMKALYSTSAPSLPSGKKAPDAGSTSSSSSGGTASPAGVPSSLVSTTSSYHSGMSSAEKIEYMIYVAQNQLGKPYVYGTAGTRSFDCSGLTSYCFKQIGVSLGRTAYAQGYDGSYARITDTSQLRRGDIICMNTLTDSDLCDHVGIYLGDGYFIHASSGSAKVIVSNLSSGYYSRVFSWARRILN